MHPQDTPPLAQTGAAEDGASSASRTTARVVARHRDRWVVLPDEGGDPRAALLTGRLRHETRSPDALPVVGDRVALLGGSGDGPSLIEAVLPRRTALRRRDPDGGHAQVLAANVDVGFVVVSAALSLSPRRLERYLTVVWEGGAVPVVVLTKAELAEDVPGAVAAAAAAAPGVDVVAVSAYTGDGLDALAARLSSGTTAVLLGSSGVGKSTLVNRLLGREVLRTSGVRDDGAGRHTTTHRELLALPNGAAIIDTPGLRELGTLGDGSDEALDRAFADIAALAGECRFADCVHEREPGCAVRQAVADARLDAARLDGWRALRREQAWLDRRDDPALQARWDAAARQAQRAYRARVNRKAK